MNASKTLSALLIVSGGLSAAVLGAAPVRAQCGAAGYGTSPSSGFGRAETVRETPEERAARVTAAEQRRAERELARAAKKAAREATNGQTGAVAVSTASCAGG